MVIEPSSPLKRRLDLDSEGAPDNKRAGLDEDEEPLLDMEDLIAGNLESDYRPNLPSPSELREQGDLEWQLFQENQERNRRWLEIEEENAPDELLS